MTDSSFASDTFDQGADSYNLTQGPDTSEDQEPDSSNDNICITSNSRLKEEFESDNWFNDDSEVGPNFYFDILI